MDCREQSSNANSNDADNGSMEQENLSKKRILAFSVGHFYNDLCGSMWFTYLLLYLEKVVLLPSWQAGLVMMIGQVTDAIWTPLVGILSDSSVLPALLLRFGRRMSWHIIGTLCVTFSFPLVFSGCLFCGDSSPSWAKLAWLIPPSIILQFGWAAVQIAHLAMIPELTSSEHTRLTMTSFRCGFTVVANLFVFACLFLFLSQDGQNNAIGPGDSANFRNLGLISVGFGIVVTAVFYAGVCEPKRQRRDGEGLKWEGEAAEQGARKIAWRDWFRHKAFYQVCALYLCARVYISISQIYLSFYITETQHQSKQYVALLPLTTYFSSMLTSLVLGWGPVSKRAGGKSLFLFGALLGVLTCVAMFWPPSWPTTTVSLFLISVLLGLAQAILPICSLNATAQLIGQNTESGAFVYGAMSFLDKLSNGLIVQLLEMLNPQSRGSRPSDAVCGRFYRDVMSFVPGASAGIIVLVLLGTNMRTLGQRNRTQTQNVPRLDAEPKI